MKNFIPRPFSPFDVLLVEEPNAENTNFTLVPNVLRHYVHTDIFRYENKFFYVVAMDFDMNMLTTIDITNKIKEHHNIDPDDIYEDVES